MEVTKEIAQKIIQSRLFIPATGKYTVKVTSVNNIVRESGQAVTIVNFACASAYNVSVSKLAWKAGDFEGAIGKGTSMSASLLDRQYIPNKGETVDIEVGEHITKEGEVALVVTSIVARKAVQAKAIDLSNWDDDAEDELFDTTTADAPQETKKAAKATEAVGA